MSRFRLCVCALMVVGLGVCLTAARPGKAAHAADGPAVAEASYGANDEETATRRYMKSGAHHWRGMMVKR